MPSFSYPAIRFKQSPSGEDIILLSAPFFEILEWGGIPRKEEKAGTQTIGFQRADNKKRVEEIKKFLDNDSNVIANPILCAERDQDAFIFTPTDMSEDPNAGSSLGILEITVPDWSNYTLKQLLEKVKVLLETRLPELTNNTNSQDTNTEAIAMILAEHSEEIDEAPNDVVGTEEIEGTDNASSEDDIDEASNASGEVDFSSQSHIEQFYHDVITRIAALEKMSPEPQSIQGFTREFAIDYLKAAMIVDGQHRLLGAAKELEVKIDAASSEIMQLIQAGVSQEDARDQLRRKFARRFGISLITNDSWSEHVFQFVVVNQKATPIPAPLLTSIVATTLTNDEMDQIRDRMIAAGIKVSDYSAISFIAYSDDSPFKGLIKRGFDEGSTQDKLDMSVADTLVKKFRYLKGGKPFHQNIDYAERWGKSRLDTCAFLDNYQQEGFDTKYAYWSSENGPWREFFTAFWTTVKDLMSDDNDENAQWKNPRRSNLFNGVQLQILADDFFEFLFNRSPKIETPQNVKDVVKDVWLEFTNRKEKQYFARDWQLGGSKKTDGAVMKKLSQFWYSFRTNPDARLPSIKMS